MNNKVIKKREEGNGYYNMKEFEKAKRCYLEALSFDPTDIASISNLSITYSSLGDHSKSLQLCERILVIDPLYKKALYRKTHCYEKMQMFVEAIFTANRWIEVAGADEGSKDALASIKMIIKDCKESLRTGVGRTEQKTNTSPLKAPVRKELSAGVKAIVPNVGQSLEELQSNLKLVMSESTNNYDTSCLVELDRLRKAIYLKLIPLEKPAKKQEIIEILLELYPLEQQEKRKLLRERLDIGGLSHQQQIETVKILMETAKDSTLQGKLQQLQRIIKEELHLQTADSNLKEELAPLVPTKVEASKEEKVRETVIRENQKKEEAMSGGVEVEEKEKEQKKAIDSEEGIRVEVERCEKHKDLEGYFNLFKRIDNLNLQDQTKITLIRRMASSTLLSLFSSGAQRGQKHYIKKLLKQLSAQELYPLFNFK